MNREEKIREAAKVPYPDGGPLQEVATHLQNAFIAGATSPAAMEYFDPIGFLKWVIDNYQKMPHLESDYAYVSKEDVENHYSIHWNYYDISELYPKFIQFKNKK